MQPLLVLVDFQSAFLAAPGIEPCVGAVVDRAAQLLSACREHQVPVLHMRTAVSGEAEALRLKAGSGSKPSIGSPGYQPPLALKERAGERVLHKSGYSGLTGREVHELVDQLEVDTLLVAGLYLHACVRRAAVDAREAGWQVCVAEDAVASDDPLHGAITRRYLENRSVTFSPVNALVELLPDPKRHSEPTTQSTTDAAVSLAAVSQANSFAPVWSRSKSAARVALVRTIAERIDGSATELATQITTEVGKPVRFSELEVGRTVEMLKATMGHCEAERSELAANGTAVRRRPLGTIAVITPFNNPLYLAFGKIAPAILYGNTVVWKPAVEALGISRLVVDLLRESGCPAGLVNLVEGDGSVGQALLHDPRIDAVTITGSSMTGFHAQVAAAQRRIPLQAELGGNNGAIVWHDADLPEAAQAIAAGAFDLSGQRCTANRRVIVHERIGEPFLKLLTAATRDLPCGSPSDRDTRVGPLVSSQRQRFVADAVRRACADVGPCLTPNEEPRWDSPVEAERWHPPTILCCDDPQHEIVQEETFGPVLVVQFAGDWQESIALCNGVRQGLAAAVFTRSSEIARQFLDEACAGILKVNQSTADAAVDAPFGGWKASGLGPPEHGAYDIEFFTRPQTVYDRTFELPS